MNKGAIRQSVLEQVDWQPDQSTTFKDKVDRFINRAYQVICLEAPFLFFESEVKVVTEPDASSGSNTDNDRLDVTSDDKVLERTYLTTATGMTTWAFDGTWDGRTIEVKDPDGTWHRRQIQELWTATSGVFPNPITVTDRISLDKPWQNASDAEMEYRIYTPEYYLPSDVVELRSARLWQSTHYPLKIYAQAQMERWELTDFQGRESGRPRSLYRGQHWQIPSPSVAPSVDTGTGVWSNTFEEPGGKFDFCYTYAWGRRDDDVKSGTGIPEPKWESGPSPISAQISHGGGLKSLELSDMIDIDHVLGFGTTSAGIRDSHSGFRKRIYIRRHGENSSLPGRVPVEVDKRFVLLAEVDGDTTTFNWTGTVPDRSRPLSGIHGYQSVRFHPMPNERIEIDIRCLRRPALLVHDHDVPRIHEEAMDALIHRTLVVFYEAEGNTELAQLSHTRYQDNLLTLTKRYGMIAGLRPKKRMARVRRGFREVRVVWSDQ